MTRFFLVVACMALLTGCMTHPTPRGDLVVHCAATVCPGSDQ